ncbi:hypothetical protein ACIBCN_41565 [Nocardia sp. NPDC051052]|uniref:hypothetical protein n=1 Tax=Nocardia sp. NPDC051052 TaxID=3364322 RepID=UPI0037B5FEC1
MKSLNTTFSAARTAATALLVSAVAATTVGAAGPAHAEFAYWLMYNRGTGQCMTTENDPHNGIGGTARFAPCNSGDRRQWWLRATTGQDTVAFSTHDLTSRGKHQCLENAPGGWGLAFLGVCDIGNFRQNFTLEYVFLPDGTATIVYKAALDTRRLSVPYAAGTSYVTIRNDFPNEDPRMQWDQLGTP